MLFISQFNNRFDNKPVESQISWPQLVERLTKFKHRKKQDGPLWSPCRYLPGASRDKKLVTDLWSFVLDFDDGVTPEDLTPYWDKLGLAYVIHSTFHNQIPKHDYPAVTRWRVVFPFESPCLGPQWGDVFKRTSAYLAGDLWDKSCKDQSRMFYWPSAPSDEFCFSYSVEGRELSTDEAPDVARPTNKTEVPPTNGDLSPGDDYNERGDHRPLLSDHGWEYVSQSGDNERWRRPGKSSAWSATWHTRKRVFYCFTSSTELDPMKAYSLFALRAEMEHGGDFSSCARDLSRNGYGSKTAQRPVEEESQWDPPARFNQIVVPDFPVEVLPRWIGDFVSDVSESMQTPPDLAAMVSLSVLSAAARGRWNIEAPTGHMEPLTLYTLVALPPGERKSSVFSVLRQPLEQWESEHVDNTAPDLGAEQTSQAVIEKRHEHVKSQASRKADPYERQQLIDEASDLAREIAQFEPYSPPRLMADDVTPEELVHLLAEQGGRLALLSAEGGLFDIISGLYSEGRSNIDGILKAYDGESIRVDRRSRKPLHVPRAVLTLGLAVQPEVIQGMAQNKKFRGRGLVGRFAFSLPRSMVGTRRETTPISETARTRYNYGIGQILNADAPLPTLVQCTEAALHEFRTYSASIEPRLAGDLSNVTDWAGKLPGRLARIAGLFHVADGADGQVQAATMARAIQLGPYLTEHAQAIFALMGADPEVENATKVLKWVEKEGCMRFTAKECFDGTRGTFQKMDKLRPVIALLEEHNYIRELRPDDANKRGRKRSPAYEVNPHWA